MFFLSDIMEKGAVLDKAKYLDEAYCLGKNPINWIENGG
jgi:hypothetical protein